MSHELASSVAPLAVDIDDLWPRGIAFIVKSDNTFRVRTPTSPTHTAADVSGSYIEFERLRPVKNVPDSEETNLILVVAHGMVSVPPQMYCCNTGCGDTSWCSKMLRRLVARSRWPCCTMYRGPMYALQRVYAFAVTPQRRSDDDERMEPPGGAIRLTQQLREVVANAFAKIGRGVLATVDFELDADRAHPVRDDVMAVAFGSTQTPRAAAARLALRLSETMDNRSHAALLVVAVEADEPKRRVSLLVLPREDVVQLGGASKDEYLLNVLRDAFSTGSGLRKLARCEGHESRTQFLWAEVLDFQMASTQKMTADFWIRSFLRAKPRIDSQNGSRQLAAALQRAFDASDEDDREAVFAAMFKASSSSVARTSLERYADDEIPENLHEAFYRGVAKELARSVFTVDRAIMKESLGRRIITTEDGVVISAPAETVGDTVEVKQRGTLRVVSYSGTIEKERVARGRRAAEPTGNDAGGPRKKARP